MGPKHPIEFQDRLHCRNSVNDPKFDGPRNFCESNTRIFRNGTQFVGQYRGRTPNSQAAYEGSIPFTRSHPDRYRVSGRFRGCEQSDCEQKREQFGMFSAVVRGRSRQFPIAAANRAQDSECKVTDSTVKANRDLSRQVPRLRNSQPFVRGDTLGSRSRGIFD